MNKNKTSAISEICPRKNRKKFEINRFVVNFGKTEKRFSSQIQSENKEKKYAVDREPEGELRNGISSHSHVISRYVIIEF